MRTWEEGAEHENRGGAKGKGENGENREPFSTLPNILCENLEKKIQKQIESYESLKKRNLYETHVFTTIQTTSLVQAKVYLMLYGLNPNKIPLNFGKVLIIILDIEIYYAKHYVELKIVLNTFYMFT